MNTPASETEASNEGDIEIDHLRFHRPHAHIAMTFGNDWFARKEADAKHPEYLALANVRRQRFAEKNAQTLLELLQQNTKLTELAEQLKERIKGLTVEMHGRYVARDGET
jgi:division protein CdvB (Snf7/Vps24/ESCRT-III family)